MPMQSHRKAPNRQFDCIYDPNTVWSCKKDAERASLSARSNISIKEKQTSYRRMFEDKLKTGRRVSTLPAHYAQTARSDADSLNSCLNIRTGNQRLAGGANVCDNSDKGYVCRHPIPCPPKMPDATVNMMYINMPQQPQPQKICYRMKDSKSRGTQTLYRESSAQTLPYLPGTLNDELDLEKLELFKLPTILPGDGPPGLYEVEVLERARKRWAFKQALRIHFKNHVRDVREDLKKAEHRVILQAFEWEHWIEREENIQECQMMRLELLIRMFDKREREMHNASKQRIEMSFKLINEKRENNLRKNEIEFGRSMRRLEMKHRKIPRNWRKENITKELGDPSSEFYAPLMRYGVNPNRRHFTGTRKDFEERIYLLEKRTIGVKNLECPFEKINTWAKPKTRVIELEKNFCSEKNLKHLYDSLKSLRLLAEKPKEPPRCLVEKTPPSSGAPSARTGSLDPTDLNLDEVDGLDETSLEEKSQRKIKCKDKKHFYKSYLEEKRREEIENLLIKYEGTTIGWLMRFLAQEQQRLIEQRKMHYISLLAQKERCRRETLAALLEKKENEMRENFEELYKTYEGANDQVCREFLDEIFEIDPKVKADNDATEYITELAKLIDNDIQRWLKSFEAIQNPLNYEPLRHMLKSLIFPNPNEFMAAAEPPLIAQYIIEEVLMPHVFEKLEPYDICTYTTDHTIDRLIDNDLEYFTSECSCCSDEEVVKCTEPQREAMAILRKVIRRAVPGRRWKTEEERLVHTNIEDIIDSALDNAFGTDERPSTRYTVKTVHSEFSYWDLMCNARPPIEEDEAVCSSTSEDKFERMDVIGDLSFIPEHMSKIVAVDHTARAEDDSSDSQKHECAIVQHPAARDQDIFDPGTILDDIGLTETPAETSDMDDMVDMSYLHRLLLCIIKQIFAAEADEDEADEFDDILDLSTDSVCPKAPEEDVSSVSSTSSICSICRCDTSDEDWYIRTQSDYERDVERAYEQLYSSDEESDSIYNGAVPISEENKLKRKKLLKKAKLRKSYQHRICVKCGFCPKKLSKPKRVKPERSKIDPCTYAYIPIAPSEIDIAETDMDPEAINALAYTVNDEVQYDIEGILPLNVYAVPHQIVKGEEVEPEAVSSTESLSCLLPHKM